MKKGKYNQDQWCFQWGLYGNYFKTAWAIPEVDIEIVKGFD